MKVSKTTRSVRTVLASVFLCVALLLVPGITRTQTSQGKLRQAESFFIVSSVDMKKHQIVLKLPTEVTEVVEVTSATTYRDEKGSPIKFEDLRAGDTIYATIRRNVKGVLTVVSIRRGPMTLEELHRRYSLEE